MKLLVAPVPGSVAPALSFAGAKKTAASSMEFDLLAVSDDDYTPVTVHQCRAAPVTTLGSSGPSVPVSPTATAS
jgi:hypothetical protein